MSKLPDGFEHHKCFNFDTDDVQFVADVPDVRSVNIFRDDASNLWCAGVCVREAYQKIRFAKEDDARDFADALADAKDEYAARQARNNALFAAQRRATNEVGG